MAANQLLPLPWYPALESFDQSAQSTSAPQVSRQEPQQQHAQPEGRRPFRCPSLVELCGKAVYCSVVDAAQDGRYQPALELLCLPCQLPHLEGAIEAAFQIIVWQFGWLPDEDWAQLPAEVQEVMLLLRSLRRAEGVSTFAAGDVSSVDSRELLACALEGLRDRHERLALSMSGVATRLVLGCITDRSHQSHQGSSSSSPALADAEGSVLWSCAHGSALQKLVDALNGPALRDQSASLVSRLDSLLRRLLLPRHCQAELEIARARLKHLLSLEERLSRAMAVVRGIWREVRPQQQQQQGDEPSNREEQHGSPLHDRSFMAALHGRTWAQRHASEFAASFEASGEDILVALINGQGLTEDPAVTEHQQM